MAFFVVVHHRLDKQTWSNHWDGDDRLLTIETTATIAERCALAKQVRERVFVHRCAWQGGPARICCSARVKNAQHDSEMGWVEFDDLRTLDATPAVHPAKGQNSYEAPEPLPGS